METINLVINVQNERTILRVVGEKKEKKGEKEKEKKKSNFK